jgi:predicted O-methyltransferase YrrM
MTAHARRVTNRDLVAGVLVGLARRLADGTQRRQVLKALWIEAKRHGARRVVNVETSRIDGLGSVNVHGSPARYCTLVLTALAMLLRCERIFEIGTFRGDTSWLLAHNLPTARVYTLDLPGPDAVATAKLDLTDPEYFASWDRGARFHGTPESARIVQLFGDAAAFDFTPYRGAMDLVFVDASHSYSYVRSDTEAALTMLSETGTIVWDDYTHYAGIHAYLNELAPSLDRPIYHLLGTRLALYSRADRLSPQNWK